MFKGRGKGLGQPYIWFMNSLLTCSTAAIELAFGNLYVMRPPPFPFLIYIYADGDIFK